MMTRTESSITEAARRIAAQAPVPTEEMCRDLAALVRGGRA